MPSKLLHTKDLNLVIDVVQQFENRKIYLKKMYQGITLFCFDIKIFLTLC